MPTGAEVVGTLTAMGGAVKALAEAVSAARKAAPAKRAPADEFLVKVNDLVLGLQSRLIELQGQILQFQAENGQLREQVRQQEARAAEREGYERRTVGGVTYMTPKDSPETYMCATCFEAGVKAYLAGAPPEYRHDGKRTYECPHCRSELHISE